MTAKSSAASGPSRTAASATEKLAGPGTVAAAPAESRAPSAVHTTAASAQSAAAGAGGRPIVTSASEAGSTVIRQPALSFLARRFAFVTVPFAISKNEPPLRVL